MSRTPVTDKQLAQAYKDLETDVWDLVCMAEIVRLIGDEDALLDADRNRPIISGPARPNLSVKSVANIRAFAETKITDMIDDFATRWLNPLGDAKE